MLHDYLAEEEVVAIRAFIENRGALRCLEVEGYSPSSK
jgi:hypothetical protein